MLEKYSVTDFLSMRRKRIELAYQHLNPMQRQAVLETEGPLLLLAGAGSGKTTVLINRIANLIRFGRAYHSDELPPFLTDEDCALLETYLESPNEEIERQVDQVCAMQPAAPWSIIAITFTNKAAKELKERLEKAIGIQANDVWASTFHSACVRILRRDIDKLGFDKSFTIYDTADSERVMKDAVKELRLEEKAFPAKAILNVIGKVKDSMMSPESFEKNVEGDYRLTKIANLYAIYQKRLKEANAMDFDDIIMHTVRLLQEFPEVREYYQNKFRYVLIDEYQDTNHAQYLLASLLAGKYENICVVGDDDQSIYRFRGATIENILEFEDQYDNAKTIRLEQNYRSTKNILDVANSVIANNQGRKSKRLWTDNAVGELPRLYCAQNESDEANFIADTILDGYAQGKKWRDFAVLYRINAQSNQVENAFKRNGVPYRIIGGLRFFDRAEIKDMLAYLWVIHNPSDTLRLKRIINVPARKIGQKTIETIDALALEQGISFFDVLERASAFPELHRSLTQLLDFTRIIRELQLSAQTMPLSQMYDELVEKSGYVHMLIAKNDDESKTRIENIQELKSNILEFEQRAEEDASLGAFLDEIALFTDIERYDGEADAVVMMTIHSAKGLEFPTVFLCGVEEGVFPGIRSFGLEEEIEEERRLFYVAVTRARQDLYITNASSRMIFGQTTYNRPSRFIEEVPRELLEKVYPSALKVAQASDITNKPKSRKPTMTSSVARPKPSAPVQTDAFRAGDRLSHKSFGPGIVITAKPVGGDILLEIAFDKVGTKRLLLKTAAQYLTKESKI